MFQHRLSTHIKTKHITGSGQHKHINEKHCEFGQILNSD